MRRRYCEYLFISFPPLRCMLAALVYRQPASQRIEAAIAVLCDAVHISRPGRPDREQPERGWLRNNSETRNPNGRVSLVGGEVECRRRGAGVVVVGVERTATQAAIDVASPICIASFHSQTLPPWSNVP